MIFIPFSKKVYIRLLAPWHLRSNWPPVLTRSLTYILKFLPRLLWANLPYTYFWHSTYQISYTFFSLRSFIQGIRRGLRLLENFRNKLIFLRWGVFRPTSNPQAAGTPLFGCQLRLMKYIYNFFNYLKKNIKLKGKVYWTYRLCSCFLYNVGLYSKLFSG
jgi:hypothetical protein